MGLRDKLRQLGDPTYLLQCMIRSVVIIFAILLLTNLVLFLMYPSAKSKLSMNSDQNLFMQLHNDMLSSSTPAYGRR